MRKSHHHTGPTDALTQREKAVITAHATIERVYGVLIGVKPAVANLPGVVSAINDGLEAVHGAQKLDAF